MQELLDMSSLVVTDQNKARSSDGGDDNRLWMVALGAVDPLL